MKPTVARCPPRSRDHRAALTVGPEGVIPGYISVVLAQKWNECGETSSMDIHCLAAKIPRTLPTVAEIEGSNEILSAHGNRKIVRVGDHFVVKYGEGINGIEAENMAYVREVTAIKVPEVYACFTAPSTRRTFIIMEYIEGNTLASAWTHLNDEQKSKVTSKLRHFFDELRHIPSLGFFGSLGKGPLLDEMFWTREKIPSINGPFQTDFDLNEAMAQKYLYDDRASWKADYYRQSLPNIFKGHPSTFHHGDCQRKNIIIGIPSLLKSVSNGYQSVKGELELTIIDWEKAGWYPSYWEYSLAICTLRWDDDWCLRLHNFLAPCYTEAPWLQTLRLELWS